MACTAILGGRSADGVKTKKWKLKEDECAPLLYSDELKLLKLLRFKAPGCLVLHSTKWDST